jgi:hypothetical protein
MSDDPVTQSMRDKSDEELLAITSGMAIGYTEHARAIAEAVLRERRVELPADLKLMRKHAAVVEAEANRRLDALGEEQDRAHGRALGLKLIVLGVGAFVLPFFGRQFSLLTSLGWLLPIVAAILAITGIVLVLKTTDKGSQGSQRAGRVRGE